MTFAVGSLVSARGREWVVLPETTAETDLLVLRPLGGADNEITGIYVGPGPDGKPFESVTSAEFPPPDPAADLGDHRSCRLLRDAVRIGTRSVAGPFRCFGRIAVEPRPYQLLPLLLALRQDPIRLLIADDVGIGKTVEALLIARELLDRGEIRRVAVLCPPHLAEQWQRALRDQFHLDAELVLAGTAARLERDKPATVGLFEQYPITVVSTDYIKQDRRRAEFLRTCPELIIVDEAHTCSAALGARSTRAGQIRHQLLREIVDPAKGGADRHLILVTATPHSGSTEAFRSLLGLLDPELEHLPEDLSGDTNRKQRERVAVHLVQRQRGDLTSYLNADTPFPQRETAEHSYELDAEYKKFMGRVLAYCRETVEESKGDPRHQRIRWWSALALLRALSSSPAAAAASLRKRAGYADLETAEAVDAEGRRAILDLDDETLESIDVAPGAADDGDDSQARRLRDLAATAEGLAGKHDKKLKQLERIVGQLLEEGFAPIVFCRFIPTVDYVADHLRKKLKGTTVIAVDGSLVPDERERRVQELELAPRRVLVCTDCLSEGINLQDGFSAVVHYDLAWNPTRHEQREGRVDRYNQKQRIVRALTLYGADNPVDGIVLDVLLRKHKTIQAALGIAVPVPGDTELIGRAIMEGVVLRKGEVKPSAQLGLGILAPEFDAIVEPLKHEVNLAWEAAAAREKKNRTVFAHHQDQQAIQDELLGELSAIRRAVGDDKDVERFVREVLPTVGATVNADTPMVAELAGVVSTVRDALDGRTRIVATFRGRPPGGGDLVVRTHPITAGLARFVLESALDAAIPGPGRRCGVVRTRDVKARTTLLLLRFRYHLQSIGPDRQPIELLAEDLVTVGFTGSPAKPEWLPVDATDTLLTATPTGNIDPAAARDHLAQALGATASLMPAIVEIGSQRGAELLEAHRRVRKVAKSRTKIKGVALLPPVDLLGAYIYLPAPAKAGA
jgi:superfamily II DNA or RNA helicase